MNSIQKQAVAICAALAIGTSTVMGIAACSNSGRSMTDEEIRTLVSEGDANTLEKAKEETGEAVREALDDFDLNQDQRSRIETAIIGNVNRRIDGISRNSSVPDDKDSSSDAALAHPRIEDGTPIAMTWDAPKAYSVDMDINKEHVFKYDVVGYEAKAYNYAEDTPYAGGGYAYSIKITITVTSKFEHNHEPYDEWNEPTFASRISPVIGVVLEPYGLTMTQPGGGEGDDPSYTCSFSISTNMIPEHVTVASFSLY